MTLKEDNTAVGLKNTAATWQWADQSKGTLRMDWKDGHSTDLTFSPDGRSMSGKTSTGLLYNFTRSTDTAPNASAAPPPPAPKPAPSQPASTPQLSPVGTWNSEKGAPLILKDDGTASRGNMSGTWKWTDQSKGALSVSWPSGVTVGLTFPAGGGTLSGKNSKGAELNFTRGN